MADLYSRVEDKVGEMAALRYMCQEIIRKPHGFFSVYGQSGNSKSLVLTILIAELCSRRHYAVYFNAGEIEQALKPPAQFQDGRSEFEGDPNAWKSRLKRAEILAIDEIDKIRWSEWNILHIGEVLEYRYRYADEKLTLFAMNKPPEQWINAANVAHIASRLRDGRFGCVWPEGAPVPPCIKNSMATVDGKQRHVIPGCMEITLPDMRATLAPKRGR